MIRLDVAPGSPEWIQARLGIPTASAFERIVTPGKLEFSKSAEKYALELLCEAVLGAPLDEASSGFMERGTVMEQEAADWYAFTHDVELEHAGFCLRDDRGAGCTPDRFVGDAGLLEIKCPSALTHMGYLLDEQGIGYRLQVQGQLWVTGREWNDTLSYHPRMPKALVRQHRDEKVIGALAAGVARLHEVMYEMQVKLQRHGMFLETAPRPLIALVA